MLSLLVGAPKLLGAEKMRQDLAEVGVGLGLMRVIGALEVAAAVGLQIESLRSLAAAGMILMMIGALVFHLEPNTRSSARCQRLSSSS